MTSSIPWRLNEDDLVTVYVIYRREHPHNAYKEVSPIVHDTLDRKNIEKKIQKTPHGYINWTDGLIQTTVTLRQTQAPHERYTFAHVQTQAEKNSFGEALLIFKSLDINAFYQVSDFLVLNPTLLQKILEPLKTSFHVKEITYPTSNAVQITGVFFLYSSNTTLLHAFKPSDSQSVPDPPPKISSYATTLAYVVIDVRNLPFKPVLFPEIFSAENRPIILPQEHSNYTVPYVRYVRSLRHIETYLPSNSKPSTTSPPMIIQALTLSPNENSRIILIPSYHKLLRSNPTSIHNLASGGLIVLTD